METPLTIIDFLKRAELVYGDRIGVVDEPDQPATPFAPMTYREMAERARGQAAFLDDLGVGVGSRVAIVSQNSARLLTSFFGVMRPCSPLEEVHCRGFQMSQRPPRLTTPLEPPPGPKVCN